MSKKSGKAWRSVQLTEKDYGGKGGGNIFRIVSLSSELQ